MRTAVARLLLSLAGLALFAWFASPSSAATSAARTGGASAESASGGSLDAGALPYNAPTRQRPVARVFRVSPRSVREGARLKLRIRIDERGVKRVSARIVALDTKTRDVGARFEIGRIRTGRTVTVRWPSAHVPKAGRYLVRLHVKDPQGATLARAAKATGKTRLVVRPRPRPESPQPEPQVQPTPLIPIGGGVFPVAGAHTFGASDGRFGAGRKGHVHEGQDIAAAEGTPVVSPLSGTVRFVDNQPGGAGWYVVLDADDGRTLFFAHMVTGSITVAVGQRVAAGQGIGLVGQTGSATGPHLHFEIWVGGGRDRGGRPIDPLPQLLAWDVA
jgi:murein DD-endopeptidase MepM/ murein hydrolase activator NlpD